MVVDTSEGSDIRNESKATESFLQRVAAQTKPLKVPKAAPKVPHSLPAGLLLSTLLPSQ